MKIKQLLGMMALDANANEVGKIDDVEFDKEEGQIIKIMIWDHNKERVYDRTKRIFTSKAVQDRVWGVAHHWYTGDHFEGLRYILF